MCVIPQSCQTLRSCGFQAHWAPVCGFQARALGGYPLPSQDLPNPELNSCLLRLLYARADSLPLLPGNPH